MVKWTKEEIELLINEFPNTMNNKELEILFPNRTSKAIQVKASKLGLERIGNITEDGYCICKKCKKKLPYTPNYFPKLQSEKNLRQVCRVCNPKYGKYIKGDYIEKDFWSEEEDIVLKEHFANYTNDDLQRIFFPNRTKRAILERSYKYNLKKSKEIEKEMIKLKTRKIINYNKGKIFSPTHKKNISIAKKELYASGKIISHWKGRIVTEEERKRTRERLKGKWSGANNPRHKNPLYKEANGRWMGGITYLSQALREQLSEWKNDSMIFCDYKCFITGAYFDEIHHVYPFNKMIKESLDDLGLDLKNNLSEYRNSELIISKIKSKHTMYGICLNKDIHKIFHDNYGYHEFNLNDFIDFMTRYFNSEFDEDLNEECRSYNSHINFKESMKKIKNINYIP